MIFPLICYFIITAFFVAAALTVSALWLKIVCWIIVAAITLFVGFCFWISQTYGKMGRGGS